MTHDRHPDADLIDLHGGPTKTAELMGILDKPGAVQRVSNWSRRGIPAEVKLKFPHLFLQPELAQQEVSHA